MLLFPILVSPEVQAFALYAGSSSWPASEASLRTGTLVIVRRPQPDGSTVTDVRTFPIAGHRMALRAAGAGRIVRDPEGHTMHIEVSAKSTVLPNQGHAQWDRTTPNDPLTGWSESSWQNRHPVTLPKDVNYGLGIVEALTYDPQLTVWSVPNPADRRQVSIGVELWARPYCAYALGPARVGRFAFQGRPQDLAVRRVHMEGDTQTRATVNGRRVDADFAATVLFDVAGRLVGLGYQLAKSNDLDSLEWGGTTENIRNGPPLPLMRGPFDDGFVYSFAAAVALTPVEEAGFLQQM